MRKVNDAERHPLAPAHPPVPVANWGWYHGKTRWLSTAAAASVWTADSELWLGGGLLNCVLVPGQEQTRQEEDIHKLQYDQQGNNNKLSCGWEDGGKSPTEEIYVILAR